MPSLGELVFYFKYLCSLINLNFFIMKKHFYLLLLFFAITFYSQAQVSKGTILLGGNVGFSSQKTENPPGSTPDESKNTYISLSPSIGKAIKDNLVAGINLNYAYSKTTETTSGVKSDQKTNSYGLGVFLREYIPLGKGFSVFTQETLGGFYSKTTSDGLQLSTATSVALGFYPGIAYNITKQVQLETGFTDLFSIGYSHSTNTGGSKTNGFSAGANLSNGLENFVVGCRLLL